MLLSDQNAPAPRRASLSPSLCEYALPVSAHSLINLGRLVELQEALLASLQVVLHEQWNILSEAKLDGTAELSCQKGCRSYINYLLAGGFK